MKQRFSNVETFLMSACYDVLLHINEGQDAIEKNAVPSHDKPKDVDVRQDSKILHL